MKGPRRREISSKSRLDPGGGDLPNGRRATRAYRIVENPTAWLSEFDYHKLAAELMNLQKLDFDLGLSGFTPEELIGLM